MKSLNDFRIVYFICCKCTIKAEKKASKMYYEGTGVVVVVVVVVKVVVVVANTHLRLTVPVPVPTVPGKLLQSA